MHKTDFVHSSHEYTVEVDRGCSPQRLNFFIDGEWYFSTYEHEVGAEVWAEVLNHGHFLLLNVAMGGAFPDSVRGGKTVSGAPRTLESDNH